MCIVTGYVVMVFCLKQINVANSGVCEISHNVFGKCVRSNGVCTYFPFGLSGVLCYELEWLDNFLEFWYLSYTILWREEQRTWSDKW
jgi:hypothetical protein